MSRWFEDFEVGARFRSEYGRTILDADNVWFTMLTLNTNPIHFDYEFARATEFGRPLVNSCLTLSLVVGMSVADVSQNGINLGWSDVRMPAPLFVGDTLHAETEVVAVRPSESRPSMGVVTVLTRGRTQQGTVVIELTRSVLVRRRP